jgi:hypothetical protein
MTVRGLMRLKTRARLVGVVDELCSLTNKGSIAFRCKSQITKQSELRFHAELSNGGREVRLEWGDRVSASCKANSANFACIGFSEVPNDKNRLSNNIYTQSGTVANVAKDC